MYKNTWVKLYTKLYYFIYSFFILCIEFYFARMQTKICLTCLHHIEGWAGLPESDHAENSGWRCNIEHRRFFRGFCQYL
jgi:hypothetical protein